MSLQINQIETEGLFLTTVIGTFYQLLPKVRGLYYKFQEETLASNQHVAEYL